MNRYCVVWHEPGVTTVSTLWYRPEGKIRTYARDAVDPRSGDVTYAETKEEVMAKFARGTGSKNAFAMPVSLAIQMFGWKREEFADA